MLNTKQNHAVLTNNEKAEGLSEKYSLVNTGQLIDVAEKMGFTIHSVKYPRSKKEHNTALHVVRLDHADFKGNTEKQERPQIVITNSHNGTSSLRIMAGVFRLVCSNGLVAGTNFLNIRLRHVGLKQSDIEKQLEIACKKTLELATVVEKFKQYNIKHERIAELLNQALFIKGEVSGLDVYELQTLVNDYNRSRLNRVRRIEDNKLDAWTVLNRLQENSLLNSSLVYQNIYGERHYLRATNNIQKQIELNQRLWSLIENEVQNVA